MFLIKPLPEFTTWLDDLADAQVRGVVVARIKRLERGLMGDVEPVGEGVSELRHTRWLRLARVLHTARWAAHRVACWRLQANAEERHKTRQSTGCIAGLTGETNMSKRIKVADLPEFDAAPYLDSETSIAAYLTDILEANDAGLLAAALGDIARARGMAEIAKSAGITREALYKALRPDSAPRFDTVSRVCAALGVRLVAQPVHSA